MAALEELVSQLVEPVDPDGSLLKAAEKLATEAERQPAVQAAVAHMHAWLAVPIDYESLERWAKHRRADKPTQREIGPELEDLFGGNYIRVRQRLKREGALAELGAWLEDGERFSKTVTERLNELSPKIVGKQLVEIGKRASQSPRLSKEISDAVEDLGHIGKQMPKLRLSDSPDTSLFEASSTGGSDDSGSIKGGQSIAPCGSPPSFWCVVGIVGLAIALLLLC